MEKLNRSKKHAFTLSGVAIAVYMLSFPCRSEIQFDGSVGAGGVHNAAFFENGHYIFDSDGQIVGSNLFYSFSHFNLPAGESVYFNSTVALDNVISRVTGGIPSHIDGSFNSFIDDADFWFINPAGIVFGDQASLNINGSFYVSTANYLKFSDDLIFDVNQTSNPILTSAVPEAFGFLSDAPASVTFTGANLQVGEGKTFAVVGGDINIQSMQDANNDSIGSFLVAPSGRIALVSLASSGEVAIHSPNINTDTFAKEGLINISSHQYAFNGISTRGNSAGEIVIRGGDLTILNSYLFSDTMGNGAGKKIDIQIRDNINILGLGAAFSNQYGGIYAGTFGAGKGADVSILAKNIFLDDGIINASNFDSGTAGNIKIKADNLKMTSNSEIKLETYAKGHAGDLTIETDNLEMVGISEDFDVRAPEITASSFGDGSAGRVSIHAKAISMINQAAINLDSQGKGTAGQLTIEKADILDMQNSFIDAGASGFGDGGRINITASIINIKDTLITSASHDKGNGGDISIHSHALNISGFAFIHLNAYDEGHGGDLIVETDTLTLNDSAEITSSTYGKGSGGSLSITAKDSAVLSGYLSSIKTTAIGDTDIGNAGKLTINTPSLTLSDKAAIKTNSYGGSGDAGDIVVNAETIHLLQGGQISSSSGYWNADIGDVRPGSGSAGSIQITATKNLVVSGDDKTNPTLRSGIYSQTIDGKAGSIRIDTAALEMSDRGQISTDTTGNADAGKIDVHSGSINMDSGSEITSGTGVKINDRIFVGNGKGGLINVVSDGDFAISDVGTSISTDTQGNGQAGEINLHGQNITIESEGKISSISTSTGDAGKITIDAEEKISLLGKSTISTNTSSKANAGEIALIAKVVDLIDESQIKSSSLQNSIGSAGNIIITAGYLSLSKMGFVAAENYNGSGGNIDLAVKNIALTEGGTISSTTRGIGNAGGINIREAQNVEIKGVADNFVVDLPDGGNKFGLASGIYLNTAGTGNGGNLDLQTQHLKISDGGLISAVAAFGSSAETQGGDITIQADSIDLQSGGLISAATSGIGKAGNVNVTATDSLSISGTFDRTQHANVTNPRISDHSGINNSASFALDNRAQHLGSSGSIRVNAGNLSLTDGGEISVANEGTDAGSVGGSISIDAGKRFYSHNGRISAATASAEGGDITLKAQDMIHLVDSQISTSVAGGKGSGGNINIDPQFLILDNSQITAQALQGAGGNIKIIAEHFIATPDSILSASSQFGVDGKVIIDSPDTNMLGKMATLTTKFLDPATLFKEQCEARYNAGLSSLSVMVTDVKAAPGESYLTDTPESTTSNSPRSCQKPIQQNSW